MKILAVDTSANVASVAITENDKLLGEYYINNGKTHSQKLMPLVKGLLKGLDLNTGDIDLFSASIGPGSFTGIRIGVTTIKAMAFSLGKPVAGISTLDALAYNISDQITNVCPIMDARNNQVFTAVYKLNAGKHERITEYLGIEINELINIIKETNNKTIFLGDGVLIHKEHLVHTLGELCGFPNNNALLQRASSVAQLAYLKHLNNDLESCYEMNPYYLRKSQAEREFEKK